MSTGLAGSGRNFPQWFPVTSLSEKVLVAYLADWLLMTLTVDIPYLIAACLVPAPGPCPGARSRLRHDGPARRPALASAIG
jgi:hypothetical protein